MSTSEQHRKIVQKLLETKAVDFTAIGKVLGEVGPSLAQSEFSEFDDLEGFCGTMRRCIRVCWINNPGIPVENLGELAANAGELKS